MNRSKKARILVLCASLSAFTILASCASKPAAPEPAPIATPEPEPVVEAPRPAPAEPAVPQEELDQLLAAAQAAKRRAFDFKIFEVLPEDYKAADAAFASGKTAYDAKDGKTAKEGLSRAKELFDALTTRGLALVVQARRESADAMRKAALAEGADIKEVERFGAAEAAYAEAAALENADAIAVFERARVLYELSYKRTRAGALRARILDAGFAVWDSGNFRLAENKYAEEDSLFHTGGDRSARELAFTQGVDALDEATLRYNLVIQKGRQGVATSKKENSDAARARSEAIKANVAVKEGYAQALAAYDEGAAKYASGDYEAASAAFETAARLFDEAYALAADKRRKAEEAMRAAKAAAEESRRKAEAADAVSGN